VREVHESRTDPELAVLASRGEQGAFVVLMRRHSSRVRALLRRMGAQGALADDLSQDAFLAAWQSIGTYRGDSSFGTWVCRIAARLYVKRWRYDARHVLMADTPEPEGAASHESASNAKLDLDEALVLLSPAERLCVSLCHGAGMSHSEAAQVLKTPLGTVKSHVKRGLDKLKAHLDPQGARDAIVN